MSLPSVMTGEAKGVSPVIMGLPGLTVDPQTKRVIEELSPCGFILFKRNCEDAAQLKTLCDELRALSPFHPPLIFIDQEGGRVNRIMWEDYMAPAGRVLGEIYEEDPEKGIEAARLNAFVIAHQLARYGITVNCLPLADLAFDTTTDVIGDRAFSRDPKAVGVLCAATISGLLAGGVWPIIKHAPGHGRAMCDSHKELPVVDVPLDELMAQDFAPFVMNKTCPFVMTAHITYPHIDAAQCATNSSILIQDVLRGQMGLEGLIVSDDINMEALEGTPRARAEAALSAGCDLLLHCNGNLEELETLVGLPPLGEEVLTKLDNLPRLRAADEQVYLEARARLNELLTREDAA